MNDDVALPEYFSFRKSRYSRIVLRESRLHAFAKANSVLASSRYAGFPDIESDQVGPHLRRFITVVFQISEIALHP